MNLLPLNYSHSMKRLLHLYSFSHRLYGRPTGLAVDCSQDEFIFMDYDFVFLCLNQLALGKLLFCMISDECVCDTICFVGNYAFVLIRAKF
jgi:hypothetical protein